MVPSVAVVTDSTAYLTPELIGRLPITVVPMQIVIGGKAFDDDVQVGAAEVAQALREWAPVTTSRPSPERFADAYETAAAAGALGVVSLHLSAALSGTYEAARFAAEQSIIPVEVIDSRSLGMGLGFPVLAAAAAAARGLALDDVAVLARQCADRTRSFFYVDTLEYLRRGGRIGAAATLVGSALMIKPLLHITDGRIAPKEKVRTAARALTRLEDLVVAAAGDAGADIAVQHLASEERAANLAERLRRRIPRLGHLHVGEVGAAIGAHVGPGMLGVVASPHA